MEARYKTALLLSLLTLGMVGLSFAAVPLYDLFCRVTGYGGTTQQAVWQAQESSVPQRVVQVRFDANVAPGLDWEFAPPQTRTVALGEEVTLYYRVRNLGGESVGTSTFNVTPHKVGSYFMKTECFCFTRQPLGAGEDARLAVSFFIDPAIVEDRALDKVSTLTLSYTFFDLPETAHHGDEAEDLMPRRL